MPKARGFIDCSKTLVCGSGPVTNCTVMRVRDVAPAIPENLCLNVMVDDTSLTLRIMNSEYSKAQRKEKTEISWVHVGKASTPVRGFGDGKVTFLFG